MTASDSSAFRRVSVASVSEIPDDIPAELSVETRRATVTADAAATIEICLRWTGETDATLLFGSTAPMELPALAEGPPPSLLLVPTDRNPDRDDSRPECWRPDRDSDDHFGHPLGLRRRAVAPGETVACEAAVWSDYRTDDCLPPGRYTFTDTVSVADRDPAYREWSFSLRIERP
ncbi:hypothetical protein [Halorussus aquaticus]|uniref:Intracellular proteinase inhibitor n=1 Tax=Halorussus aquaticus TaxID=2953748 RepID=A0ABD5Q7M1_9EURY|nr:hypothetical protein [Halorussus aquaticus]